MIPMKLFLGCLAATLASSDVSAHDYFDADYIRSTLINVAEWQLQHLPPGHQPLGAPIRSDQRDSYPSFPIGVFLLAGGK